MTQGSDLPDELVVMTDDKEAESFLRRHNLYEPLVGEGFTHGVTACCGKKHISHWVLALKYAGLKKEADNGLHVICWPKSKFQPSVMIKQLEQMGFSEVQWQKIVKSGDASGLN